MKDYYFLHAIFFCAKKFLLSCCLLSGLSRLYRFNMTPKPIPASTILVNLPQSYSWVPSTASMAAVLQNTHSNQIQGLANPISPPLPLLSDPTRSQLALSPPTTKEHIILPQTSTALPKIPSWPFPASTTYIDSITPPVTVPLNIPSTSENYCYGGAGFLTSTDSRKVSNPTPSGSLNYSP